MQELSFDHAWSDLHINHKNILVWRGYLPNPQGLSATEVVSQHPEHVIDELLEGMFEDIKRVWNRSVGVNETVLVFGDIAMGPRLKALPLLDQLNGEIKLLPGNHDHCWKGNKRRITETHNWVELYGEHVDEIIDDGIYDVDGLPEPVQISHFPYFGDHTEEDRYDRWRPDDFGRWLLHGHVHDLWRQNGKMINFGADAWHRPVHVSEIAEIMTQPLTFKTAEGYRDFNPWG